MKEITLTQLKELSNWEIDKEIERHGELVITHYGKPSWSLRAIESSDAKPKENERATE